ncbi:hypothetical protein J6590_022969, partial [Homalodisca vitripennis]
RLPQSKKRSFDYDKGNSIMPTKEATNTPGVNPAVRTHGPLLSGEVDDRSSAPAPPHLRPLILYQRLLNLTLLFDSLKKEIRRLGKNESKLRGGSMQRSDFITTARRRGGGAATTLATCACAHVVFTVQCRPGSFPYTPVE